MFCDWTAERRGTPTGASFGARSASRAARHDEERLFTGQPFEHMGAAFLEPDPCTGDQILDRIRDQDFSGRRRRRDARADVDRDAN